MSNKQYLILSESNNRSSSDDAVIGILQHIQESYFLLSNWRGLEGDLASLAKDDFRTATRHLGSNVQYSLLEVPDEEGLTDNNEAMRHIVQHQLEAIEIEPSVSFKRMYTAFGKIPKFVPRTTTLVTSGNPQTILIPYARSRSDGSYSCFSDDHFSEEIMENERLQLLLVKKKLFGRKGLRDFARSSGVEVRLKSGTVYTLDYQWMHGPDSGTIRNLEKLLSEWV